MTWRVAVDLGGTNVRTALTSPDLELRGRAAERTCVEEGPEGVIAQVIRLARESAENAGVGWDEVDRAAIGAPGPLNSRTGMVLSPPNMPGWVEVPLRRELEGALEVPVEVVNDANAGALGEFYRGAGRGRRHLVYITVSTGVGGGVVADGHLLVGTSGFAGEIGHMTVDLHGPVCRCGNIGCVEVLASGTAIARRFGEALAAGADSAVTAWTAGREARAEDVAEGARRGDPVATRVFLEAAEALAFGVINCIHLFNPEVVALGGGVTGAGPLLFEPLRRTVERFALAVPFADVRIVPAELGTNVGLVGAAAVAWYGPDTARAV